jgi:hypothetical protein
VLIKKPAETPITKNTSTKKRNKGQKQKENMCSKRTNQKLAEEPHANVSKYMILTNGHFDNYLISNNLK